jgi:hypothetical protein
MAAALFLPPVCEARSALAAALADVVDHIAVEVPRDRHGELETVKQSPFRQHPVHLRLVEPQLLSDLAVLAGNKRKPHLAVWSVGSSSERALRFQPERFAMNGIDRRLPMAVQPAAAVPKVEYS